MLARLLAKADAVGYLEWAVSVDSTVVRAPSARCDRPADPSGHWPDCPLTEEDAACLTPDDLRAAAESLRRLRRLRRLLAAVRSVTEDGQGLATSQLTVTYLNPGKPGQLVATAQVRKRGKSLVVCDADVEQDGRPVVHAVATFALLGG